MSATGPHPWLPMDYPCHPADVDAEKCKPLVPTDGTEIMLFGAGTENRAYFKDGLWRDSLRGNRQNGVHVPILFAPRAWRPIEGDES